MKRFLLAFALAAALLSLLAAPALADRVYHSQHIVLMSDTGATVGFVENIHANGPTIYAQERYVLLGAEPGTYTVTLTISSPSLPDPLVLTSATFTTNAVGNGVGKVTFSPADAGGLRGQTVEIFWTVSSVSAATYHTSPQTGRLWTRRILSRPRVCGGAGTTRAGPAPLHVARRSPGGPGQRRGRRE